MLQVFLLDSPGKLLGEKLFLWQSPFILWYNSVWFWSEYVSWGATSSTVVHWLCWSFLSCIQWRIWASLGISLLLFWRDGSYILPEEFATLLGTDHQVPRHSQAYRPTGANGTLAASDNMSRVKPLQSVFLYSMSLIITFLSLFFREDIQATR